MDVVQISVFLENRSGRLAEVAQILSNEGINIRALSLADTADFGVLRIIVDRSAECLKILREAGFVARETEVLALEVEDRPGGLHHVLDTLGSGAINVEYVYAFVERKKENAIVVFKVDDKKRAIEVLQKNQITVVTGDVLDNL